MPADAHREPEDVKRGAEERQRDDRPPLPGRRPAAMRPQRRSSKTATARADREREPVDTRPRGEAEERGILVLGVAERRPRKAGQDKNERA